MDWNTQWPAELRTCPSCVLRSALFGVVQRGRRKALERTILAGAFQFYTLAS